MPRSSAGSYLWSLHYVCTHQSQHTRIEAEFGTADFDTEVDAAIAAQIALYGNEGDYINAQRQRSEECPTLPTTPAQPGNLRWYWNG